VDELLDRAIELRPGLPFMPETQGLFYLVARPLTTDDSLLDRIIDTQTPTVVLNPRFSRYPLGLIYGTEWRRTAAGAMVTHVGNSAPAELEISTNGAVRFFGSPRTISRPVMRESSRT
jgi:hypothetical protein